MIRIDIVWKKILGCVNGDRFFCSMDVQIFTFFLWLLPILALVYFVLLAIANQFISAGWPGFPFGGAHLFGG